MGFLEDLVACRIAHQFDKENREWYKECNGNSEKLIEYYKTRRRYILSRYRQKLKEENQSLSILEIISRAVFLISLIAGLFSVISKIL